MKTITAAVCEGCKALIPEPKTHDVRGVRVVGNIYVASAVDPPTGGLIGKAPRPSEPTSSLSDVAYCWVCFLKCLGWGSSTICTREEADAIFTGVFAT